MAIVAALMLGPGRTRPIVAAQLWGGPIARDARPSSYRAVIVERHGGLERLVAKSVALEATASNGARGSWEGASGEYGTADIGLAWDRPPVGAIEARLRDADGQVLAEGSLPEHPEGWATGSSTPALVRGHARGEIAIRVAALRGVLAAPFREEMVTELRQSGMPVANARVAISTAGAVLDRGEAAGSALTLTTDARGRAHFGLAPNSHDVELVIEATSREASGRFEARLPVLLGAMWLEPAAADARLRTIVSPVPREVAYFSVATREARLFGATVALHPDGRGFARGQVDLGAISPALREEPLAHATLASSFAGQGAGTVGWPLSAFDDPFTAASRAFRDVPLLDGIPPAQALERDRRRRAAWVSGLVLLVAALVEGVLLSRAARAGKLSRAQASAEGADEALFDVAPVHGALGLYIALVLTLLAFAAVGIIVILQSTG